MGGKRTIDGYNQVDPVRGKFLMEAIYRNNERHSFNQKKSHINTAFFGLILGGFVLVLCIYALFIVNPNDHETIFSLLFLIFIFVIFMLFNMVILKRISLSRNEIYENGISSGTHSYFEYRAGKTFHFYEDITMIGWGFGIDRLHKGKTFRFIVIYKNNSYRHTTVYADTVLANNFLDQLINVLKQKCPNAPWVQVDWKSLPLPK